jgi:hypothetical protein
VVLTCAGRGSQDAKPIAQWIKDRKPGNSAVTEFPAKVSTLPGGFRHALGLKWIANCARVLLISCRPAATLENFRRRYALRLAATVNWTSACSQHYARRFHVVKCVMSLARSYAKTFHARKFAKNLREPSYAGSKCHVPKCHVPKCHERMCRERMSLGQPSVPICVRVPTMSPAHAFRPGHCVSGTLLCSAPAAFLCFRTKIAMTKIGKTKTAKTKTVRDHCRFSPPLRFRD